MVVTITDLITQRKLVIQLYYTRQGDSQHLSLICRVYNPHVLHGRMTSVLWFQIKCRNEGENKETCPKLKLIVSGYFNIPVTSNIIGLLITAWRILDWALFRQQPTHPIHLGNM